MRVRVCDTGEGFQVSRPSRRPPGAGGYGLVLLERLSDRWGVNRNGGFCVWFEVRRERLRSGMSVGPRARPA